MSDLQFEDNVGTPNNSSFKSRVILGESQTPGMVHLAMRLFHFKSEKSAGNFLIAITLIFFLLTILFSFNIFYKRSGEVIVNPNLPENIKSALPQI